MKRMFDILVNIGEAIYQYRKAQNRLRGYY